MSQPSVSVWRGFTAMLQRDLTLYARHRSQMLNPLVFAAIVATLFPLAIGPEPSVLAALAPGLVWVVCLLACMLSVDQLFKPDFQDGSLELWLNSPQPGFVLVLAKLLSHWLAICVPIALMSPLLGLLLALPLSVCWPLFLSIVCGSVVLSGIGAIGAALTVGVKQGGLLISLLVLPLYVPVLIFGVSLVVAASQQLPWLGYLALVGGMALLSLTLSPLAIVGALKLHIQS